MTMTVTQLTTAKTQTEMKKILEIAKGSIYAEKHSGGFEILDLRPMAERFDKEIEGSGVVRCFGMTHFVVSAKLISKFSNVVYA